MSVKSSHTTDALTLTLAFKSVYTSHPMSKRKRKILPTELQTATVTQCNHEGRGITHINGKTTFLFGGLPGETVQFRYTQLHRQYDEGVVVSVIEKSQNRVEPQCAHFGICGGCSLQHLSNDAQRAHKQSVLLEHFQHQAHCQPEHILPPLYDYPWEYRRRARLSIRFVVKKNDVLVGFRERGTSYVAELKSCEILDPSVGKKIAALRELFMHCEMKAEFAQLEVAIGDATTAVILRHMKPLPESDIEKLITFATESNWQLYFQPGGHDTIHPVYPKNPEPLFYTIPNHTIKMVFKPAQFTQINQSINLKMIDRAIALLALEPTDHVLDLFCGIGNFSLPMAKYCKHVVGVEGAETSILQAKENAQHNGIQNADFYVQDLSADIKDTSWSQQHYNKILLDPPRAGAKEMMPLIAQWQPSRIVYVSCNPITLARDTKELLELGYCLVQAGVMDMFPHTDHIEAIALFIK